MMSLVYPTKADTKISGWRRLGRELWDLIHQLPGKGAFGSSSLTTIAAACGESFRKHAPQAPRVGAHDVILTGLDEESDSTNEEMPPLEPLEGAAQLGEVWLCGHERRM